MKPSVSLLVSGLAALAATCPRSSQSAQDAKPNIVLIVADDFGWKDLGCYGSDFYLSPNIDKLAADGVRFTQAYSACTVCSPSRAALLTGKYPARLHVTDWIPGQMPANPKLLVPDWTKYLPLEEVTIAEALKQTGYATASIGKWHLGNEEFYPKKQGFDLNIAGTHASNPSSYFAPYRIATIKEGPEGEYITDRLGDEALRFIDSNKEKPFFLYLPHFAVHTPIQAKKPMIEKSRARNRPDMVQSNAAYAAMIESMDDTVGRIRQKLTDLGIAQNTVIIFTSDNGGRVPTTSNSPLRVGKGSCYEGGTRVPLIVHWPGITKAGTSCETPVIGMDLFPTILEMVGLPSPTKTDGKSIVPLLKSQGDLDRKELFWHYPHYQHYQMGGTTPYGAIRSGDFKLIEFFSDMHVELYNLAADIGEQDDLTTRMPDKVKELRDRLHQWREEVGAQMPSPNPHYDPSRPEHDPQAQKQKSISLLPEKVGSLVPDKQDFQTPDRVRLSGWVGTRIDANAYNRLANIDPDRLLEGFRKRPGRQKWDGEHVGKWMHAATLAWANTGDPNLRKKLDLVAAELVKCQLADGYLGTYEEKERWTEWDVWAHKYNLIGLITYMRYTGNLEPLPACRKMADLLCNTFGDEPGKMDLILAGQHMGMAPTSVLEPMVLLYRFTGEQRYLDFCKYIMRAWEQPNGPKIVSTLLNQKRVDRVGNGKAYEMLSCLNGALEFYRITGDTKLLNACLIAWQDIMDKRLYITGAASYREFFRDDYDFPNFNNVGETCVTTTWLQFNAYLLRLTGEARFAEQLERVILNQLFGAQCPDGSGWGYYVQMEGKKPYSSTLDGHCCLSSGPRGVALIPTFACTTDADGVVLNLYDESYANLKLRDGTNVIVLTQTLYPGEDRIRVKLQPDTKTTFTVKLRIPEWCKEYTLDVNGKKWGGKKRENGYIAIRRGWKKGDELSLVFKQEPRVIIGDHKNENKLSIAYGPLVLAADEAGLGANASQLSNIGFAVTKQAASVEPKPASGALKTWPGARLFHVDALARKTSGSLEANTTVPLDLVPFADAGLSGTLYKVWLPYGSPRADRNLLYDGIETRSRKPSSGSILDNNTSTVASTQSGKRAKDDWFTAEVNEPGTVGRIVFVHGQTLPNGGWFDASVSKPRLEGKASPVGPWQLLHTIDDYPATTSSNPAGLKDGQAFTYRLSEPMEVYGIRVVGSPASGANPKQNFSTCAELQAFAQ